MSREVFNDAGAWVGVAVTGDQHHSAAAVEYRRLLMDSRILVTTNLAIAEAYVLIRRAGGFLRAAQFLESLRQTPRLRKVYSDAVIEERAERILAQFHDQDFSFVDAVSFAVMQRREINEALAFD